MAMNFKEVKDLIKLINESNITEFRINEDDFKLSIRTKDFAQPGATGAVPQQIVQVPAPMAMPAAMPQAAAPQVAAPTPAAPQATPSSGGSGASSGGDDVDESKYIHIKSPMVGTFYRAPSPDKPEFVKIGDTVSNDTVVCVVEAMKLFNDIEAEVSGKIVKVLVDDATPVEYDQPLFLVDPS